MSKPVLWSTFRKIKWFFGTSAGESVDSLLATKCTKGWFFCTTLWHESQESSLKPCNQVRWGWYKIALSKTLKLSRIGTYQVYGQGLYVVHFWQEHQIKIEVSKENSLEIKCSSRCNYFLRSKKVETLDWARPFPGDASSTSHANKGPASSAAMAHGLPAIGLGRADSA